MTSIDKKTTNPPLSARQVGSAAGAYNRPLKQGEAQLNPALDEKLQAVAKLYEKQFLREMVKEMRKTSMGGGFIPEGQGERIFKEQLDHQYVETWGDQGGIGFGNLIYEKLKERFLPNPASLPKKQGPFLLNDNSNFVPESVPGERTQPISDELSFLFKRSPQVNAGNKDSLFIKNQAAEPLYAPLDGTVVRVQNLENGFRYLELKHDENLKSRFLLPEQVVVHVIPNQEVKAGEDPLVSLSPQSQSFSWKLHRRMG